jgi:hypothetical protein
MAYLNQDGIKEISIFISDYHKESFFIFLNEKNGSFRLSVESGKKRLENINKESTNVFEIESDVFLVYDLIDTMTTVNFDTQSLLKKYGLLGRRA